MKKTILFTTLGLLLIGCSQESKTETKKTVETKIVKQDLTTPTKVEKVIVVKAEVTPTKVEKVVVAPVIATKSGQELFMACSACHGKNGEKVALGKSKVIKGWSVDETITALNGYKDGSYGGAMKSLMKGQTVKLSDDDIAKLAKHISTL